MTINVTWVLFGIAALVLLNLAVSWLQTRSGLRRCRQEQIEQWAAFKDEIGTRRREKPEKSEKPEKPKEPGTDAFLYSVMKPDCQTCDRFLSCMEAEVSKCPLLEPEEPEEPEKPDCQSCNRFLSCTMAGVSKCPLLKS